jgi:orotidine-5'-phosphate decarboxylase
MTEDYDLDDPVRQKLCAALDVSLLDEVEFLVRDLLPKFAFFKVGLELALSTGAPQAIDLIHGLGGKVFLDLKLHDIPETISKAVYRASGLGVEILNVHASAGIEGIRAAVVNRGNTTKILVVTVLTAFNNSETMSVYGGSIIEKIKQFSHDSYKCGADGIVCAVNDIFLSKLENGVKMFVVTPGIRPKWFKKGVDIVDHQKRIATPTEAIAEGSDLLVIGRPVVQPPSDVGGTRRAAKLIYDEVAEAMRKNKKADH